MSLLQFLNNGYFAGKVGIGTNSPSSQLAVASTGANPYSATLDSTSNMKGIRNVVTSNTDDMVGIYFATGTTTTGTHWSGITGSRTDNATDWGTQLNFYTHDNSVAGLNLATQKMVIKGDGNVGIGTTSPGVKLTVVTPNVVNTAVNVLKLGDDTNGLVFKSYFDASGIAWRLNKGLAGINMVTLSQGGNVGIGTTSPGVKLSLRRESNGNIFSINRPASNTSALYAGVSGNDTSFYSNNGVYKLGINNPVGTGGEIPFITMSPTNRYTTFTAGNVGIGTTGPSEKLEVAGNIKIQAALLSNQENTDVDTGTETVANVAIATYTAAFFDFVVKKTTNVRSGTVYACHDGTNVEFTETSTNDLGDTSDVTLSVDISGGNMRLLATVTSDDWSVKSLIRAI